MFWWISLCKLISNYPSFLSPHRRGGIRRWLGTSLPTGRVRVVALLLAWRFGSRSCFAPLRKFQQPISYVRPRYARVAASARVAGYPRVVIYPCVAEYPCVSGYPCIAEYPRVVIYPCLTLMAQVFLFLDVAAQVAFLHASKIPQRPNAVERSAVVLDAVLFQ